MKNKKVIVLKKIFIIFTAMVLVLASLLGGLIIGFNAYDNKEFWSPNYKKIDIAPILAKEQLTSQDYDTLYMQTGLTKIGIDRLKSSNNLNLALEIQKDFFSKYETYHHNFAPLLCAEMLTYNSPTTVPLEDGDILISPTTHFSCFEIGHSALVVDGDNKQILNALNYSTPTSLDYASFITNRPTFIILRVKAPLEVREKVAKYAYENLLDIEYSILAGALYSKNADNLTKTQCAHIIYYAYNKFGINLDSNNGMIVMPKDIFKSKNVEVVQIYGLNPKNIWQ